MLYTVEKEFCSIRPPVNPIFVDFVERIHTAWEVEVVIRRLISQNIGLIAIPETQRIERPSIGSRPWIAHQFDVGLISVIQIEEDGLARPGDIGENGVRPDTCILYIAFGCDDLRCAYGCTICIVAGWRDWVLTSGYCEVEKPI